MWILMAFIGIIIGTPKAVFAEDCGSQAGGAVCAGGLCCSQYGWCGDTSEYCGTGCQSQCSPPQGGGGRGGSGSGSGVASIITESVFNEMLKHRNEASSRPETSTLITPSLKPQTPSLNLAPRETPPPRKKSSPRFWPKHPTKPLVGGEQRRMVHTHGDTAS